MYEIEAIQDRLLRSVSLHKYSHTLVRLRSSLPPVDQSHLFFLAIWPGTTLWSHSAQLAMWFNMHFPLQPIETRFIDYCSDLKKISLGSVRLSVCAFICCYSCYFLLLLFPHLNSSIFTEFFGMFLIFNSLSGIHRCDWYIPIELFVWSCHKSESK